MLLQVQAGQVTTTQAPTYKIEQTLQSEEQFTIPAAAGVICLLPQFVHWVDAHFSVAKLIDGEFVYGNPSTEPYFGEGVEPAFGVTPIGRRVALDGAGTYRVRHAWHKYVDTRVAIAEVAHA